MGKAKIDPPAPVKPTTNPIKTAAIYPVIKIPSISMHWILAYTETG